MRETIAMTNEKESAIPTMRMRRAFISSLVRRFSGFMGSVFLGVRWLWWFRSCGVCGQRNYSGLGRASALSAGGSCFSSIGASISYISSDPDDQS